jgi:hypothetical protein
MRLPAMRLSIVFIVAIVTFACMVAKAQDDDQPPMPCLSLESTKCFDLYFGTSSSSSSDALAVGGCSGCLNYGMMLALSPLPAISFAAFLLLVTYQLYDLR